MHIKLGNGDTEMGAVRLANGNWAVLLQKHDTAHAIGEHANNVGEVYTPTERDVIIEIGKVESGRVLQDAVNHALLFASGLIKPADGSELTEAKAMLSERESRLTNIKLLLEPIYGSTNYAPIGGTLDRVLNICELP